MVVSLIILFVICWLQILGFPVPFVPASRSAIAEITIEIVVRKYG
jgi:hypothetical protein